MLRLRYVILLVFFFVSCTVPVTRKEARPAATPTAKKLYQEAQEAFDAGNDRLARQKLEQQLKSQPSSLLTDDAYILLGRIDFRKKNFSSAYDSFAKVFTSSFHSSRENEARILGVQCLLAMNKMNQADRLIRSSLKRDLNTKERSYLLEAQLPILLKSGSQLETFEALAYLAQHHPNSISQEKYRSMAKDQIDMHLKPSDLKDLSENSDLGEFRVEAMFQYAMELVEDNKLDTAKVYFERVMRASPNSYLGQQARSMVRQLEARSHVETNRIGIILPLSGDYAPIGKQVLHGVQQALGISGTKNQYGIQLEVMDSKGSPEEASKAAEELVLEKHVVGIIGGLSSKTAVAEVTKSQELGTPFISLSQSPGLTRIGPFVFRSATTPRAQVESLVTIAMEKLNVKNFAVLYPNDKYGVEFSNLFWDEVLRRGGKITAAQTYQPGETDFKDHVKKMVGLYYIEDRKQEYAEKLREWTKNNKSRRKKPPEDLLDPIVNFEALFIPDSPKAIGQIAPMLAFYDVRDVHLLGTNLWNSPDFVRRGQNFVTKSLFLDTYLGNSDQFTSSPFYKEHLRVFNTRPGTFAVQGYDAGKLALEALRNSPKNRIDFLRLLSTVQNANGAVSKISMGDNREIVRPLIALTVENGQIIPLQ